MIESKVQPLSENFTAQVTAWNLDPCWAVMVQTHTNRNTSLLESLQEAHKAVSDIPTMQPATLPQHEDSFNQLFGILVESPPGDATL